jgi:hypothetical protein
MSEGQLWLWRFHSMNVVMHYNTADWLEEAGLPVPYNLRTPPPNLIGYWRATGQYEGAQPHVPNTVPPPYVQREHINPQPPPQPTYLAE